ncbi:MAG: hypothetical protein VX913_14375 [Planctomycetota bacterium]|nr:hypothetical protein [Planctomycetota bacterium]
MHGGRGNGHRSDLDAVHGVLFDPEQELVDAMRCMQDDGERRHRRAEAGQAAGEGPWLEETPISRYPQLVRGAAERKGAQDVMEVLAT